MPPVRREGERIFKCRLRRRVVGVLESILFDYDDDGTVTCHGCGQWMMVMDQEEDLPACDSVPILFQ